MLPSALPSAGPITVRFTKDNIKKNDSLLANQVRLYDANRKVEDISCAWEKLPSKTKRQLLEEKSYVTPLQRFLKTEDDLFGGPLDIESWNALKSGDPLARELDQIPSDRTVGLIRTEPDDAILSSSGSMPRIASSYKAIARHLEPWKIQEANQSHELGRRGQKGDRVWAALGDFSLDGRTSLTAHQYWMLVTLVLKALWHQVYGLVSYSPDVTDGAIPPGPFSQGNTTFQPSSNAGQSSTWLHGKRKVHDRNDEDNSLRTKLARTAPAEDRRLRCPFHFSTRHICEYFGKYVRDIM